MVDALIISQPPPVGESRPVDIGGDFVERGQEGHAPYRTNVEIRE